MTHGERKAPGLSWLFQSALLALTFVLVLCPLAQAQYRTSIQGVVTDASGAVIPGATLTLINPATNEKTVRTSNAAGVFNFNALAAAATFNLEASAKGFQKKVINNLELVPDQSNGLTVQLAVGGETQTVTVDATVEPLLTTSNANTVGTINEKEVQQMPSFGRDVFQLVQLAPGVFGDGSQQVGGGNNLPGMQGPGATGGNQGIFQTENGPAVLAHGGQYENNSYTIDGISTTSAVWGGTTIITPSEDSVAAVTTVANAYDAEYGRFSGAHVDVTSKTGTNQVHGSLFFTRHSAGLNSLQKDNGSGNTREKDTNQFNQLGGSVGFPIWKNKLFGFFDLETVQNPAGSPSNGLAWFDTSDFDALANPASLASKYLNFPGNAPHTTGIDTAGNNCTQAGLHEGVDCNTIAGKGINVGSPLTIGLGKQDPTFVKGTALGVGNGLNTTTADFAYYNTQSTQSTTKYQYNGRVDANISSKDAIGFALYWVPQKQDSSGSRGYDVFHHQQTNEAYTAIWNHTFTPNFLNELRANVAGWHWNEISSNPQSPLGLPVDSIDSLFGFQVQSFGPNVGSYLKQWTYGFRDLATMIHSRHTLKYGAEYNQLYYLSACYGCGLPSYNFYNTWDFINDAPHNESVAVDPATGKPSIVRQDDLTNIWGFFAQDDWKAKRNLTINLGLRWSYFGPVYDKHNRAFVAVPGAGSAFFSGMTIRKGGNAWDSQKNNFGPQIGFSWSPEMFKDKMVVRGGYGLNFNQDEFAITQNTLSNNGFSYWPDLSSPDPQHINPNILYALSSDAHNITGFPANTNTITSYGANGLPTGGAQAGVALVQPSWPTMRTHHFSLDAQYDLGHQIVASLGYQGSVTHNSYFHMEPLGWVAANGWAQNPNIGSCCDYWTHMGHANFNSMLAEVKHQFSHQFMADAQYSWSKSMDTSSAPYSEQFYLTNLNWNYGPSDYNVAQAFKMFGTWSPVLFKGNNAWMEKIAGGWSVSGIFNAHTGFPWNPVWGLPASMYDPNAYYGTAIPGSYLGGAGHSTSNSAYRNGTNFPANPLNGKAYFGAPVITGELPAKPGVGRNSWTLPGYKDVDLTIIKAFGMPKAPVLGEAAKLEFRLDIYNLFNNVNMNPGSIQTDVGGSRFGQETTALGARVMTLGARFNF